MMEYLEIGIMEEPGTGMMGKTRGRRAEVARKARKGQGEKRKDSETVRTRELSADC